MREVRAVRGPFLPLWWWLSLGSIRFLSGNLASSAFASICYTVNYDYADPRLTNYAVLFPSLVWLTKRL